MSNVTSAVSKLRRDRARALRHGQTDAEAVLWESLRAGRLEGWKWRRQVPVGPFIVDFLCLKAALAIELDGGVHAERAAYDARRSAFLRSLGLTVLRFDNAEVTSALDHVRWKILSASRESDPAKRGARITRR